MMYEYYNTFIFVLDQSRLFKFFLMLVSGLCQNNKIKIVRTASVKFDIIIKYQGKLVLNLCNIYLYH
jgi:hypothetical protein